MWGNAILYFGSFWDLKEKVIRLEFDEQLRCMLSRDPHERDQAEFMYKDQILQAWGAVCFANSNWKDSDTQVNRISLAVRW